jgi:polyhydroxyalkanoate synthesis regulator phasin
MTERRDRMEVGELVQDMGLMGLGVISLSRDMAEGVADTLMSATGDSRTEGNKMRKQLEDMAERGRETLFSMIRNETRVIVDGMNLATKDDLRDMEKRMRSGKR